MRAEGEEGEVELRMRRHDGVWRVHPEDRPRFVESIALARTGVANHEYDIRLQMSDAAVKHIRASAHVSVDREGGKELVGVMQDTTARTLAEEALGKIRSELSEMTKVSHAKSSLVCAPCLRTRIRSSMQ
ncbi:hypothetical protein ACSFA8_19890 [Variovorax sp. RT4R15]|uniref:hypothetical protein n=1 Tax=Variovorax sp. RT4R15 TaxID=3443737 RepID=UPI003F486EF6